MNYLLIISFVCMLVTSILFAFPRCFLAKVGFKGLTHPEDFGLKDTWVFYIIFGILMSASWTFFILSIPGVL